MDLKTVSELSELFGVTRQAMNNRIKKLPAEFIEKNEKGTTVVNARGIRELEEMYGKKVTPESPQTDGSLLDAGVSTLISTLMEDKNAEIRRLHEQLRVKDTQIANKDSQLAIKDQQISEKDKQLDQQQQLTAKAMADTEQLRIEANKLKGEVAEAEQLKLTLAENKTSPKKNKEQADSAEEDQKGFFSKLFGKKEKVAAEEA